MTNRAIVAVTLLVVFPVGIATWILGSFTIGESLSPGNSAAIGFAVGLLVVAALGSALFLIRFPEAPNVPFGITLVACGTGCILLALALQYYLAALSADSSRRAAEILRENMARGQMTNVNLNTIYPESVRAIAYLAMLVGIWFAAMGIRIGIGGGRQPGAVFSPTFKDQPLKGDEIVRHAPDH